jgi:hypothetical protein
LSHLDHGRTIERLKGPFPQRLDLDTVRSWLDDCKLNHYQRCPTPVGKPLRGLKLIDCHNRKVVVAPPGLGFFALSYVWGESDPEAAKGFNVLEATQLMPQTNSQSIQLTLDLGYQFLWIDRYVSLVSITTVISDGDKWGEDLAGIK